MKRLDLKELKKCFKEGKKINWHDDYEWEGWKDGRGPLIITDIHDTKMLVEDKEINCSFIRYKCSDDNCRRCNDNSLILQGHFKIVKTNGLDLFGKVVVQETKKKTLYNVISMSVFKCE